MTLIFAFPRIEKVEQRPTDEGNKADYPNHQKQCDAGAKIVEQVEGRQQADQQPELQKDL